MKILYIHQYFVTPQENGASRSYWFAKKMIEEGYKVTMITATNHFNHSTEGRTNIDGIDVIYIKNNYSQELDKKRKVLAFLSFMNKATQAAMNEKDVNLVFATSTPLSVGIIALILKAKKKWEYIFEVRDLWPEFPIQIGAIRNKYLISILKYLEQLIYRKAKHIIALSPGMKDGILKCGIEEKKVSIITNMSKKDIFYPHKIDNAICLKYGIDRSKFNIAHIGSMGISNGLESVLKSAEFLQNVIRENNINFIMIGNGAQRDELMEEARNENLLNVKFIGNFNTFLTAEILNCCNMSIVSFKNLPILYTNSPNKLFDSLSAGKPIIVNSNGWTRKLIEENLCGFYANPDNPKELAYKLINIKDNIKLLDKYSKNARKISIELFDKSILTERLIVIIRNNI